MCQCFGDELALIRESDKPFLGTYCVQGAWGCLQAAWCTWAPFAQKSEHASSSCPLHSLGNGQNTRVISIWKSHWGEGLCCCSRQEIWPISLSLLITAQDWVRNIPIFTLYPKSSPDTHTPRRWWEPQRGVEEKQTRNWFSALALASWGTQRICIWIRGNVAFFSKRFNLVSLKSKYLSIAQLSHLYMSIGKTIALTIRTFVS